MLLTEAVHLKLRFKLLCSILRHNTEHYRCCEQSKISKPASRYDFVFLPSPHSFISPPSKELADSPSSIESLPNGLPAMLSNSSLTGHTLPATHPITLSEAVCKISPSSLRHRSSSFLLQNSFSLSTSSPTCSSHECVEAAAELRASSSA